MKNLFLYRILQLISLLLGVRIFVLILFLISLYIFAFFFIGEYDLKEIKFDTKIHGIIFCSVLSIAAGSLINLFYDREKDKIIKPFRSQLQSFLKQKYILYFYLIFNALSLGISFFLSYRIFLFFFVYQFFIWFYSHKISKKLILNNLLYVSLSLYPFFGILVYYQYFSIGIILWSIFLFLLILNIDIIKDILTLEGDKILNYQTIPIVYGVNRTISLINILLVLKIIFSVLFLIIKPYSFYSNYFTLSGIYFFIILFFFKKVQKSNYFILLMLLKIWVFVGGGFMLYSAVLFGVKAFSSFLNS